VMIDALGAPSTCSAVVRDSKCYHLMSRGPGQIERAIIELFVAVNDERALSVGDLCDHDLWPGRRAANQGPAPVGNTRRAPDPRAAMFTGFMTRLPSIGAGALGPAG